MADRNLAFVIQRAPYKQENTTLGYTHAISSQTAEIHLEDGDAVVATIILVGDGMPYCGSLQTLLTDETLDALASANYKREKGPSKEQREATMDFYGGAR